MYSVPRPPVHPTTKLLVRSWLDVSYWLIRKSKRSVYNDPVVKHGFARGTEPVAYVDEILGRWQNYKEFVRDPATPAPTPAP